VNTALADLPPSGGHPELSFLAGGGELGALIRGHDWAATPLGPAPAWPQSLKTAVRIMLTSRQPIWIGWGPGLTFLYNDAYKSIIGGKHPNALGRPTADVWREIWADIGPLLATAMGGVEGTYVEEQLLIMERNGYPEETYYTFSYSPIPGDDGQPGGIICANSEDTHRVVGDRQLALLRELAAETVQARSWRAACERSATALARDPHDITFALLYVIEPGQDVAELAAKVGLDPGAAGPGDRIALDAAGPWPIGSVARNHTVTVVANLEAAGLGGATGIWNRPSERAALLPVPASSDTGRGGVLIVGLNPYRLFDADYSAFLSLVAGQISAAIASADAYEEERRRAEALAELDRAKTAFFSNVSHEFRTPLTLMLGPLEEVLASGTAGAAVRAQVELAHRNGTRLLRLVNSLLDFSRIEAGRVRAAFEPVDLGAITAEIASGFRSAVERAGLELDVRCQPLPLSSYVDREMWEKIVLNLLSNAFKFTLSGGIRVTTEPAADGRSARVSVADTGIGIPAGEIPRLFERFYRVEGAHGRSFEGSGIGLALVAELVRLHGGEITVESIVGQGTTFTVVLPLGRAHLPAAQVRDRADAATAVVRAHEYLDEALRWLPEAAPMETAGALSTAGLGAITPDGALRAGAGKDVLLADDNADMRSYVARLLEGQGYRVTAVGDGAEAFAAAAAAPPDLILTDVMMPKLDGFGLLRAVRQEPRTAGIPVIMLSARAGEEAKIEGLDAGADDYLVKPFAARELVARVNANIQMAEMRREASRAIWASEQRFRISQDRLSMALSTGGVGIFEWEIDTDTVAVLGPIAELFGVNRAEAEAAGLPLASFVAGIHPQDRSRVQEAISGAIATSTPYQAEYRVTGSDRERIVLAMGRLSSEPERGRRLAGVIIDVTEQRHVEQALQALNERLEQRITEEVGERLKAEDALRQAQKMEAVGQLTGGLAHDFNNLLAGISGSLELMQTRIGQGRLDDIGRYMAAAQGAAKRAAALTHRLLAFSRRQTLDPKPTNVHDRITGMEDLIRRTVGPGIAVAVTEAADLWAALVDPNQLENALLNLCINARDAMPDGGRITIATANRWLDPGPARERDLAPGPYVSLCVTDTGTGMAPDVMAKAFEPFFTTKPIGQGTGLGLSMIYGFAQQSGGQVRITSEIGQGTTVCLYLPRHDGRADAEAAPSGVTQPPRAEQGETVLVVDDEPTVRMLVTEVLDELGYTAIEATDSASGLQVLQSDARIDLLITDIGLPGGMNGRQMADAARAQRPGLKVLFITGYAETSALGSGQLAAGMAVLTKPFVIETLGARIREIIAGP
jgi:signal transduction histidine kinase